MMTPHQASPRYLPSRGTAFEPVTGRPKLALPCGTASSFRLLIPRRDIAGGALHSSIPSSASFASMSGLVSPGPAHGHCRCSRLRIGSRAHRGEPRCGQCSARLSRSTSFNSAMLLRRLFRSWINLRQISRGIGTNRSSMGNILRLHRSSHSCTDRQWSSHPWEYSQNSLLIIDRQHRQSPGSVRSSFSACRSRRLASCISCFAYRR